jgi:hypothetical protein
MGLNHAANWEITIDGKPRSYRDDLEIALEAARYLKSKHPASAVAVRNYRRDRAHWGIQSRGMGGSCRG